MKQEKYEFITELLSERVGNGKWVIDLDAGTIHTDKGRELGKCINMNEYYQLHVHLNGVAKTIFKHEILAICEGLNPVGLTINHKDSNKLNNSISNLEVITFQENMQHAVREGKPRSPRLPIDTVREVKRLLLEGLHNRVEISNLLDVAYATVRSIDKGRSYKGVCI